MPWPKGRPRGPKKPKTEDVVEATAPEAPPKKSFSKGSRWAKPKAAATNAKEAEFLARVKSQKPDWRDRSSDDLLALSPEGHDWLASHGLTAQWIVESVFGQPQERRYNQFLANGWVPVEEGVIPGLDAVAIGGVRLVVRPQGITERARKADKAAAKLAVQSLQDKVTEGIRGIDPSAARHPTALRHNRINRSFERIDVAGDD